MEEEAGAAKGKERRVVSATVKTTISTNVN